jgi:tetratricopeptide (TPR) repeat protein
MGRIMQVKGNPYYSKAASLLRFRIFDNNEKTNIMRNKFLFSFAVGLTCIIYSAYSAEPIIDHPNGHSKDSLIQLLSEDVDFLVERINNMHPAPWRKIKKNEFDKYAGILKSKIPDLTIEEFTIELMRLTSRLQDGHTMIIPSHPSFNKWFPVRFARFEDGIFVIAADIKYNALVGGKVNTIGGHPAEFVFNKIGECLSNDSQFGFTKSVPAYMSNAVILNTLNFTENIQELPLEIVTSENKKINTIIPSFDWQADPGWLESRFQIPGYGNSINIFSNTKEDLPLHLKNFVNADVNYWFEYLPESETLYMQFNTVADMQNESFFEFNKRLWNYYDSISEQVDKFVLDLRYNRGGNGYLLKPFVHEIIKHEKFNSRGHLYIIQGSHTFSAGVNCIAQIIKNTAAITVGEPTAGPLNWCSDIQLLELPNSKLMCSISTLYWQEGHPSDTRGFYPPEFPVPVTFNDFSSGKDEALDAILNGKVETLLDILLHHDGESFMKAIIQRKSIIQNSNYLIPYTEVELRNMSHQLLESDRRKDALIVLQLNAELYPESWEVWEDLGIYYSEQNDIKNAIDCFEKSLTISPGRIFTKYRLYGLKNSQ